MTYNVLSGTLNSTIPYLPHFVLMLLERLWVWQLVMCCCVTTSYTLFTPCACPQATEFHYLCNNLEGLKLAARWWPQKGEENQYPNDTELPYSDLGLTVFLHTQQLFNCSLSGGGAGTRTLRNMNPMYGSRCPQFNPHKHCLPSLPGLPVYLWCYGQLVRNSWKKRGETKKKNAHLVAWHSVV